MPKRTASPEYLSPSTVGQLLDVDAETVRDWCRRRLITYTQTPGGQYRIPKKDLMAQLESATVPSTSYKVEVAHG